MQAKESSFSLVDDDYNADVKTIREAIMSGKSSSKIFNLSQRETLKDLLDSDSDDDNAEEEYNKNFSKIPPELSTGDTLSHVNGIRHRIPSAGPSGRQVAIPSMPVENSSESESDSDDHKKIKIPGAYDAAFYENMEVNDDIKELFQYITKYIPQNLNLDFKFKPFIPDFIPAVGDIDAFLKVVPPDEAISDDGPQPNQSHLGLTVLDEPTANQSDMALLHLQLRASSVNVNQSTNMVVKTVDNVEKKTKTIDKWIKDITDLHRSKSSPIVKYSEPMPDLDDLMQEWPEKMENLLKIHGFPNYKLCHSLSQYINVVCSIFDIPIYKNKIQSLHLLFSLYAAVKNSQLYTGSNDPVKNDEADQLVLE